MDIILEHGADGLRDLSDGDDPGEERRERNDDQDLTGALGSVDKGFPDALEIQLMVDEQADDQRIRRSHSRRLGGAELTAHNTAENDDRHEQRQQRIHRGLDHLTEARVSRPM